jgi:Leucine-rich repeat (LRR) protein
VLHTLHVDTCGLVVFPLVATTLPTLSVLGLGNNSIASVPPDINLLTRLSDLDLRNNSLTALPPQLALLPLRSLLVEGNILRTMRRSVLARGTAALLEYLKERLPAGTLTASCTSSRPRA